MGSGSDQQLRTGDWVRIKSPGEIAETLDAAGNLENLPFMPEMIEFCGRRMRVVRRAEKTCIEYPGGGYKIREFLNNNVVVLEDARCSGGDHDGCQRACTIFWKEAWFRKLADGEVASSVDFLGIDNLRAKLSTKASPDRYICQSTELAKATQPLTRGRILAKCIEEIRSGSRGILEMISLVAAPMWRKATRKIPRKRLAGTLKRTPAGNLGLQPGEWVTIRPASEIAETLDNRGRNRGLSCDYGMSNHSGEKLRVRHRLDRMISEPTGEMRKVESTVVLEGLNCTCANVVGGCPRQDFIYWREIWLKRLNAAPDVGSPSSTEQGLNKETPSEVSI
jgi:hypothetical protein